MKKLFFLLLVITFNCFAQQQNPDPNALIIRVREKFKKVQDYQADVAIKVNVDFVKVPDMTAKIYFKQPDKVKLQTDGFAMIPKQAFNFSPEILFKESYSAIFIKNDKIGSSPVSVIKVIPTGEEANFVLATLWIDTGRDLIRRVESSGKKGGSFQIDFNYDNNIQLPASIKFVFDIPKNNMPKNVKTDADMGKENGNGKKPEQGSVSINYSNYKINKGIPDSIFEDNKTKKK